MFSRVVMFEYPCPGSYAIGFMTNENTEPFGVTEKLGRPVVSVFMPTTPNPTSGFLFLIPKERCTFLDMSVADAMRLIVSAGAVLPGQAHEHPPGPAGLFLFYVPVGDIRHGLKNIVRSHTEKPSFSRCARSESRSLCSRCAQRGRLSEDAMSFTASPYQ